MLLEEKDFYKKTHEADYGARRRYCNFEVSTSDVPMIKEYGEANFHDIWTIRDTKFGTSCIYLCGLQDIMMLRFKFSEYAVHDEINNGTVMF